MLIVLGLCRENKASKTELLICLVCLTLELSQASQFSAPLFALADCAAQDTQPISLSYATNACSSYT